MQGTRRAPWRIILAVLTFCPVAEAVTITRGPFLQLQTPSSMNVVWFTDSACTGEVEWGLTTGYGQVSPEEGAGTRHEVSITGLSSATLYHYRVRCGGVSLSGDATFRTAPASTATAVSFTFVGDTCSNPSYGAATYNAMLPQTTNGFCVTLGDLAGRGQDTITDYWQSHFFTPAASFVKQICMYPSVGNHELYDENVVYVYPSNYVNNFSLPAGSSGTELYYSFDKGNVHFVALDTMWSSYRIGSAQYNWLAADLAATTKPWKIVFGHEGAYICVDGGLTGSTLMRSQLEPLFAQYNVDLYLHGNYHYYQRNVVNGRYWIDQGTGGQSWLTTSHADDTCSCVQAYADQIYCFSRFDIQGDRLLGRCLSTSNGTVLDGYQIDKTPVDLPWRDAFPATRPQLNWIAPWNFAGQCGLKAQAGNPSGDGYVFQVADTSANQFLYPMLANESMTDISIEAQIHYDAATSVKNRYGLGVRGRLFYATSSCYALAFVRNDSLAANGHCVLLLRQNGTETVLGDWASPDVSGWHKMRLAVSGSGLYVWIDGELKTPTPIIDTALPKGRPFVYNYRATGGAKTLVDDVLIDVPGPDMEPPSVPALLAATVTSSTSVALTWSASTDNVGVTGYEIRRDGVTIGSSTEPAYTDNSAPADSTISYDVRAYDAVPNYSAWSDAVAVTTPRAATVVFSDGFDGTLNNWTQQMQDFEYSTAVNHGAYTGDGAAHVGAGQTDQMYHTFSRPFAQGRAWGYFYDGMGGWKSACGWAYRQALSLRDMDNGAQMYVDNGFYSPSDNSKYFFRLVGNGGLGYTGYATRNPATVCNGEWVYFETTITPAAPGASPTGTFTVRVTDGAGTTASTQNLTTDYSSYGFARITLGLGASSANEGYWDDVALEAIPPGTPTMGTPTVVSASEIRWNFTPRDNSLFGWDVADGDAASVSPPYPAEGWLNRAATSWLETGLTPNTRYTRMVRAWNGTLNGEYSPTVSAWTLSVAPSAGAVTSDKSTVCVGDSISWTAVDGFGAGRVQYYKYAWDQTAGHAFTNSEPNWSIGTLVMKPTGSGTWYLHVKGYNGQDVANGTCDYAVTVRATVPADFDGNGHVDLTDFSYFQMCFNGPNRPPSMSGCTYADLDKDNDVDLLDFMVFQACFNGPSRLPACE